MNTPEDHTTCSEKFKKMVTNLTQKAGETGNIKVYALDLTGESELKSLTDSKNHHLLEVASSVEESESLMDKVLAELESRQKSNDAVAAPDIAVFINDTNHSDSDLIHAGAETIVAEGKAHGVYCIHHHQK